MTTGVHDGSVGSDRAVLGRRRRAPWLTAIGTTLVALVLLVPSTSGKGPEMDEGAVLAYSVRVLDGAVPHRDFLTFYGPGNPWLVAGAFTAFGTSIATERMVGLVYRVIVVFALFMLGLRLAGLLAGSLAGIVAARIMADELVWAYATYGAIAFGLLGLALATSGATSSPGRRQGLLYLGAGIAGGAAIVMRFDLAPAVLVSVLSLLALAAARNRIWYAGGLLAMVAVYVPHLAVVGHDKIERVIRDLVASGPGRSLPLPGPWSHQGSFLTAAILGTVMLLVVGAVLWRRDPHDLTGRVLVSAGLFSAGLFPWAISRADVSHTRPFALVSLSLLPAVALLLSRAARAAPNRRAAVMVVVAVVSLFPILSDGRLILERSLELRGIQTGYRGFYDEDGGDAARAVIMTAQRLARPGESLFVGPQDLRRTNWGPTYMYFLLPQLQPASYYMEMNPLTANREGSGLDEELRSGDWLILTSEWDDWSEPNDSSKLGPTEPNEVVRDAFCLRFESGVYRLYERCRKV